MESVRDRWTDERLDDLNRRVDLGFGEIREELRDIRKEIRTFAAGTTDRMDSLQRSIVQLAVALTSALVAGFAAICALLATAF